MSDTVEKIKDRIDILELVGSYVKLSRAGKYWRGLSPFNKEKSPSFFVSPDRGTYYCFSSNQGGDIFTFVEKMEGVDFKGAMKILAEKAGVALESYAKKDSSETEHMRDALLKSEQHFASSLTKGTPAYEYALSRGLTEESIRMWGIGYALDAWRELLEYLEKNGVEKKIMLSAGLIKEADEKKGTYYDRFRNRLMFPIQDPAGRTVAFTGRALKSDDPAKYLNSPETTLYKKSEILYGFFRAKDAIRKRGFVLLVEGQFDVVLLHQIGFQNAVAISGTALTEHHIKLMKRFTENIMFALDNDTAGLSATEKHALTALKAGMRVKAIYIKDGKDPADIASTAPDTFIEYVKAAEPIVEFFLTALSHKERDAHKLLREVEARVIPLLASMSSPLEREHFVAKVAQTLSISPDAVRESVQKFQKGAPRELGPSRSVRSADRAQK